MPELPEVERARRLIAETCTGYTINSAETFEDTIVYDGASHEEFAKEVEGRTITGCERKGKQFWLTLSGKGRLPVMHFGMTGMIQLKGQEPTWYRRKIHLGEGENGERMWPPKYCKFVLKLTPPDAAGEARELAFIDPRRLARLRLIPDPVLSHPPLNQLGFDPVLDHPTLEEFKELIAKKRGTTKGLIMDQSFSAGVGNWVADEVLYQAHIHPQHPVQDLDEQQVSELHRLLRDVPLKACEVNADSSQFPADWLFRWRWGKGGRGGKTKRKKTILTTSADGTVKVEKAAFLALPDGNPATITFITVGGRTSAVVTELQKMPSKVIAVKKESTAKRKRDDTDGSDTEVEEPPKQRRARPKVNRKNKVKKESMSPPSALSSLSDEEIVIRRTTRSRGRKRAT